jgi:hypothetical protein
MSAHILLEQVTRDEVIVEQMNYGPLGAGAGRFDSLDVRQRLQLAEQRITRPEQPGQQASGQRQHEQSGKEQASHETSPA